jgi:hypothetical protein
VIDPGGGDAAVRELYRALIALRGQMPPGEPRVRFDEDGGWIGARRGPLEVVGNFSDETTEVDVDARDVVLATGDGVAMADGRLRLPALSGAVVR